jgi:hypothetical protein
MNAGRVEFRGKPLGFWWKTEAGGYVAKCGMLGAFEATTLEILLDNVRMAEEERLKKALEMLEHLRKPARRATEDEETTVKRSSIPTAFLAHLLLYVVVFREWPVGLALQVLDEFGEATLLAAFASGLSPSQAVAFLSDQSPRRKPLPKRTNAC